MLRVDVALKADTLNSYDVHLTRVQYCLPYLKKYENNYYISHYLLDPNVLPSDRETKAKRCYILLENMVERIKLKLVAVPVIVPPLLMMVPVAYTVAPGEVVITASVKTLPVFTCKVPAMFAVCVVVVKKLSVKVAALFNIKVHPLLITNASEAAPIFSDSVMLAVTVANVTLVDVPVIFSECRPLMEAAIAVTLIAPPAPVALLVSKNTSSPATGTAPFPPPTVEDEVVFQFAAIFHAAAAPPTQYLLAALDFTLPPIRNIKTHKNTGVVNRLLIFLLLEFRKVRRLRIGNLPVLVSLR